MTCEHAHCTATATVKTRFGNGFWYHGNKPHRQTYVRYCDPHFQEVERLFHLKDVRLLAQAG